MHLSWKSPFFLARETLRAGLAKMLGANVVVQTEVFTSRFSKCTSCPLFADGQCLRCTCFMEVKAWIGTAACPERRWPATITIRNLIKAKFRGIIRL